MEINFERIVNNLTGKVNQEVMSRTVRVANELRNTELDVLRGTRSRNGRIYKRPNTKATYRASAPGEPPAMRTGVTRASFGPEVKSRGGLKTVRVTAAIKSSLKHNIYLDEGTSKMAARPFKDDIIDQTAPKAKAIISEPYFR